jgi:hypothetical protein
VIPLIHCNDPVGSVQLRLRADAGMARARCSRPSARRACRKGRTRP